LQEKPDQTRLAQRRGTALTNMAVAALIIAALYFGREIFVPLALAVLLSFVLAPFVIRLHGMASSTQSFRTHSGFLRFFDHIQFGRAYGFAGNTSGRQAARISANAQ
jgi:hypothetical protein